MSLCVVWRSAQPIVKREGFGSLLVEIGGVDGYMCWDWLGPVVHVTYAADKVKTFATNDNALTSKSTVKWICYKVPSVSVTYLFWRGLQSNRTSWAALSWWGTIRMHRWEWRVLVNLKLSTNGELNRRLRLWKTSRKLCRKSVSSRQRNLSFAYGQRAF